MSWKPSTDPRFTYHQPTPFWEALQSIFDFAFPVSPLHPHPDDKFDAADYLIDRQGRVASDQEALLSSLPREYRNCHIGPTEIECLDFLLNSATEKDRILAIVGTRGAGKSSLINYLAFLLDQRRSAHTPFLLVMDGNRASVPGIAEFTQQLGDELEDLAKRAANGACDATLAPAFMHGATMLSDPHTRDQVLHTLSAIVERLPGKDSRLLVLVFDNMDHLPPRSVAAAFQLARDIHLKCGIGTMICVRPSLYRKVGDMGGARQFVNTYERIYPPKLSAWLEAFPRRMTGALRATERKGEPRIAHGKPITEESLDRACRRFRSLLIRDRHREDDPTEFLESVSAQDMRHLTALLRRMLENSNLPSRWLVSEENTPRDDSVARFHPLSAAMEGSAPCYRHVRWVTNVLRFEMNGEVNLLILHRLLSLLADVTPQPTASIVLWMREYGYAPELVIEALEVLRTGNLVYGSDLDVVWNAEQHPEFCGLTEGGKYFLNHLLSNPDYLTAAVLDVPLLHKYLAANPNVESFAARLSSLSEYLKEVKERENRQFSALKRRETSSALKVATDRLRNGGALTAKLLTGMKAALSRARHSESARVREAAMEFAAQIPEYDATVDAMENALVEVRRKAMKHEWPEGLPPLALSDFPAGTDLNITFSTIGDEIKASITLNVETATSGAIASICLGDTNEQIATAYLKPASPDVTGTRLVGACSWTMTDGGQLELPVVQSIALPRPDPSRQRKTRFTLASDRNNRGGARVILCVWREKEDPFPVQIGEIPDCDELRKWSEGKLGEVGDLLKHQKQISTKLRGVGVALSDRILSQRGRERLLQLAGEAGSCLIMTDMRSVPWEWIIPDENDGKMISDIWDTERWHPRKDAQSFQKMAAENGFERHHEYLTIGAHEGSDKPWHVGVPKDLEQLISFLHRPGGKHLIAHCAGDAYHLGVEDAERLTVTATDIMGSSPSGDNRPAEIVLSCCNAGALEDPNLAVIFAERWECRTWAPLTSLERLDALKVDAYLAPRLCASRTTIAQAIRDGRDEIPVLKLYVQYRVQAC